MEKVSLSANGHLDHELSQPDVLEVRIDGRQLSARAPMIQSEKYRSGSVKYRLETFEPQQDGTCVARYVRVNADEI